MTKVDAVKKVLKAKGGSATWAQIYSGIERYYPEAKASQFWQEGIRGVVYREMRYDRAFEIKSKGVISLKTN
jgi:hypothetical protein